MTKQEADEMGIVELFQRVVFGNEKIEEDESWTPTVFLD
jgi:hypothetical protein